MRLRSLCQAGVAALMIVSGPLSAQAETLADAFVLAYRHSGLLEKNRAVLRAADEDVASAIAQLRPIINYTVQAQQSFTAPNGFVPPTTDTTPTTASAAITAELLLWDGGASRLAIDVARETVLATRHGLLQVEQQVLYNAVLAYLSVREAIAFVELRQSNVQLITEQLRAAQERFEVGEVTRTDVAIAEAQLASARSNLAAALGDLEIAQSQYVQAVGQEPGNLTPIEAHPTIVNTLAAAQDIARKTHPTIRRDMRGVTIAELNVLRAEALTRPQITGSGRLSIDDEFVEQGSVGIQLSGPIYRGGALSAAYRQAVARRDESRADLHITVDDILQQVAEAWAQQEVAIARIAANELQVRAARVAFRGLQEEVSLGARTTLDVLDAEQDLQDARAALISAQIAEIRSAYSLLFTMGLLTAEYLDLGIPTYDPSLYYNAVKDAPSGRVSPQGQKLDKVLRAIGR
ncbi:TolC family outer membrane protein [Palleronia abyssalis]|uniref:Outer membrane efflux protein BepC n=1 Tax=Palleronia abyssalis TaxID=1501240 RepID=A0A2R8BUG8_9RHOB|nr:TolC family outer membrane protein [Palleronia abyssalis]SPJ23798.1 Outer membrane efflux protein BepC [Palleronia abyssalis]